MIRHEYGILYCNSIVKCTCEVIDVLISLQNENTNTPGNSGIVYRTTTTMAFRASEPSPRANINSSPPRSPPSVTFTNDIGDPKLHPLFDKLKHNPRAQKAFVSLCTRQRDSAGRTDPNNLPLPALPEEPMTEETMASHKGAPEEAFARPSRRLAFSRSFFPDGKRMAVDLRRFAAKNIVTGSADFEKDEEDMVQFMTEFRVVVSNIVNSRLLLEFLHILQANPIKLPGIEIKTLGDLSKEWKRAVPCLPLAKGAFELFFKGISRGKVNLLVWGICGDLQIWYNVQHEEHDLARRGHKSHGPKRHLLHDIVATKIRENFRKKYCSGSHGIGLKGSAGKNLAAKVKFVWEIHVTGWESPRYHAWLAEKGTVEIDQVCSALPVFLRKHCLTQHCYLLFGRLMHRLHSVALLLLPVLLEQRK